MKKYITTDKHPELKEDIKVFEIAKCDGWNFVCNGREVFAPKYVLCSWIDDDYIKELQEPIWTDDDMIEFSKYALGDTSTFPDQLEQFKKEKNK